MDARDRKIETWFQRIASGQLRLPRFQRSEAWDYENVANILDSILRGLPIGSTLVLQVGDSEPFVSRPLAGAPDPVDRCEEHLLDGQQRLTALWRSLHANYEDVGFYVQLKEPAPDQDGITPSRITRVKRWRKADGRLFPLWADDAKETYKNGLAPALLLQPADITAIRQDWCDAAVGGDLTKSRALERELRDLQDKVKSFNLPMLLLDAKTPPATALDVFVKMNTSAVPLDAFDIVVAQFEAKTKKSMHDLVAALAKACPAASSYGTPEQLVLQTAALREDRVPAQATFLRLDMEDLDTAWAEIAAGISWAVSILEGEGIFDDQRLPTVTVLPVLAALHKFHPKKLDEGGNARALVKGYLWRAFITQRYENASSTRSLQDFRGLRDKLKGIVKVDIPVFDEAQYPLPNKEQLMQAGWPKRKDILARAILAVALKGGAQDIADAMPVARANIAAREYHHLFPDALLKEAMLEERDSFRALNCALIAMATNRTISAKEPLKYLRERVDNADLGVETVRVRLQSHLVPFDELNVGDYEVIEDKAQRAAKIKADYEMFLRTRAELVLAAFKALASGRDWPRETLPQEQIHVSSSVTQ